MPRLVLPGKLVGTLMVRKGGEFGELTFLLKLPHLSLLLLSVTLNEPFPPASVTFFYKPPFLIKVGVN